MDAALLQAARDAAAKLYGQAADSTRAQQQAIDEAYNQAAAALPADAAQRSAGDQAYATQRDRELDSYGHRTGARGNGNGSQGVLRAADDASVDATQNGEIWRQFFEGTRGSAIGRNESQATAFEQARNLKQEEIDQSLAALMAAGGGGGGGGSYWEDEPVWEEPGTSAMTPELVRGAIASQRRYEGQGDYFQSTGKSSNTGTPGRAKTKLRRGGGGQF